MFPTTRRIFLGCVAGALSVLVFHQLTLQVFYWLGWAPHAAFVVANVPPFSVPLVVSITFWGAVYGGFFSVALPRVKAPLWLKGAGAGLCAMLVAWFLFLPMMGHHAAFDWQVGPMMRSLIAYQMWGLGLILMLRLVHPRPVGGDRQAWRRHHLAA